jgi:lipooligosaccharide transport system permease protein
VGDTRHDADVPVLHHLLPAGRLPRGLQIFVECTPLYQGIEIVRGLMLGAVEPALIGRAVYLALVGVAGLSVVSRRLGKLLLS